MFPILEITVAVELHAKVKMDRILKQNIKVGELLTKKIIPYI